MKRVFAYLIFMLIVYCSAGILLFFDLLTVPNKDLQVALFCGIWGGLGGITYCLRGIYLNACVSNQWSSTWIPWYVIRPIVSFICGIISWLFLKAGLVVLEAQQAGGSTNLAFYAFAVAAGLNVDKFIEKIEDIAQVTWGIKKSRTALREKDNG